MCCFVALLTFGEYTKTSFSLFILVCSAVLLLIHKRKTAIFLR